MVRTMNQTVTVRADAKGRLTIPTAMRHDLGIAPGDMFFLQVEDEGCVLRFAKVENPFDVLADHAVNEYQAGRTRSLRDIAAERGVELDAE
jgi:AbrB family looped-hinge helix DNA binding protein